ncbi:uncharacterized protein LOC119181621 [Rhipicephalus microplus]|uniref:uncharacterized protein LOC119181621 n=1 Tax=Rhipicephalus microplus TaxID=6941 RepID=UPI003F6B4566
MEVYRKDNDVSVAGRNVSKPILSFDETDFPDFVTKVLQPQSSGSSPTSVETRCWPAALSGRDRLAVVPNNSEDKILAYVVPALIHAWSQPVMWSGDGPIVLVIASTRELAQKAKQMFSRYDKESGIRTACLVSG